jgi:RES domain-containing protein
VIRTVSGLFWRSVFESDLARVLDGARTREGRYHHDGQPALYISPSPDYSRVAIDVYLRGGDPPRVIVPLQLTGARIADLRNKATQRALGLNGTEASVLWQPERAAGLPATSWIASDAARDAGADGMIYAARSDPARWHICLFRWNAGDGAQVRQAGPPIPFDPQAA